MSVCWPRRGDPRWLQICSLSGLLAWALLGLGEVRPLHAAASLAGALAAQWAWARAHRTPFEPASALITGLSLGLLLRSPAPQIALLAGALAISSKQLLRSGGRHWFNPANLALVCLLLSPLPVWVSAGQWGSGALLAFALLCAGNLVSMRAERSDVTWAFLLCWGGLLLGRALWLGDPLAIPLHQMQGGALLIFAFFMISDPRTTPASRPGRIVFAALVALGAAWVQFGLYRTNGLLWALAGASLLRPLIDALWPGPVYEWPGRPARTRSPERGASHATPDPDPADPARAGRALA